MIQIETHHRRRKTRTQVTAAAVLMSRVLPGKRRLAVQGRADCPGLQSFLRGVPCTSSHAGGTCTQSASRGQGPRVSESLFSGYEREFQAGPGWVFPRGFISRRGVILPGTNEMSSIECGFKGIAAPKTARARWHCGVFSRGYHAPSCYSPLVQDSESSRFRRNVKCIDAHGRVRLEDDICHLGISQAGRVHFHGLKRNGVNHSGYVLDVSLAALSPAEDLDRVGCRERLCADPEYPGRELTCD